MRSIGLSSLQRWLLAIEVRSTHSLGKSSCIPDSNGDDDRNYGYRLLQRKKMKKNCCPLPRYDVALDPG